ncbi:mannosyltransferase [Nocardia cyriacigeorgica]|uniref:mannosyltransferase n=1 Tax=Nocardia cyriacigeorgica TaxID=135487 RepID=UPI0018951F52|nr:mannosyltransferase [Nocardia cyriacigeorgica]MBF6513223.1 mannosyltransferase [Nocardia cyriacigeorgica]
MPTRSAAPHRWATHTRWAVAALAASVLARLLWMLFAPNGMNLVDLHVYVDGSAALLTDKLYDFTYAEKTPDFPLPFTYPPFAAVVFFPLHYLPFTVVAIAWLLAIAAALYAIVRIALELILGAETARQPGWRTASITWTAIGLWLEPVRTTMDYGQVNVFLVLAVMLAVRSARWWISGTLVGVVAGIKLTPAISGLYFLARRRWATVAWSAAVFGATVGLSFLISAKETRHYFGTLLGDADRIGPVGSVWNQSLRGALSRLLGYDVETGPWWVASVVLVAVLALLAWRALGPDDRLGTLLLVQLFGLLISPISWSHHWVWLLPTVLWLLYGPLREVPGARIFAGYWLVTALVGAPWVLSFFQDSIWTIPRPWVLSWLGTVDVIGVLVMLVWIICAPRLLTRTARPADLSRAPAPHPTR